MNETKRQKIADQIAWEAYIFQLRTNKPFTRLANYSKMSYRHIGTIRADKDPLAHWEDIMGDVLHSRWENTTLYSLC